MKELSIEEKAKAYDEALKRTRRWYDSNTNEGFRGIFEDIFPILKESEDEKIRKALIDGFTVMKESKNCGKTFSNHNIPVVDILAWLEKHGEQKHNIQPKFKIGDIIRFKGNETLKGETETHKIISYDNELYVFADGTTDLFCEQDLYELVKQKSDCGISSTTKQKLEESLNKALDKETPESLNEFLNGQDEQKSTVKVEPKFKIGDWITDGEKVWKIGYIEDDMYIEHSGPISAGGAIESIDKHYHLWTIQDAKDGDVLTSDYEGGICIALLKNILSISEIEMYCHLINNDLFIPKSGYSNATWYPATKEQRDTLLKAMADAGYTFDFDKKELKKIEPKFKVGDTIRLKDGDGLEWTVEEVFNNGYYTIVCADRDDFIQLDNKWELVEQKPVIEMKTPEESLGIDSNTYNKIVDECIYGDDKPAWSEEDEGYYDAIIAKLEVTQEDALLTDNEMDFLKSLKERVLPESTWNEEDKTKIKSIITLLKSPSLCAMDGNKGIIDESIKYLKSIKYRVQSKSNWSEEDERMYRGLHNLIYSTPYCDSRKELSDWLKSLKERALLQPKQEWSEEDKKCLRLSIDIIDSALRAGFCVQLDRDRCVDWLKFLEERYTWQPSEEQMEALRQAAYEPQKNWSEELQSLYCNLKKLKEE